ncbi:hypothetical protein E2C01_083518 [Portunus trituberculatus]|uniref:Uncharacterized protein n=1 Tax=Portunus trituberculatus TaxID=210409 RepID=A0A5B7J2A0_PORTR|nr:hypothetical protein [Portunus trituberculatus]
MRWKDLRWRCEEREQQEIHRTAMTGENSCVAPTTDTETHTRQTNRQMDRHRQGEALCSGERRLTTRRKSHGIPLPATLIWSPRQLQRRKGKTRPDLHSTALHFHTMEKEDFPSTPRHHTKLHNHNVTRTAASKEPLPPTYIVLTTSQGKGCVMKHNCTHTLLPTNPHQHTRT